MASLVFLVLLGVNAAMLPWSTGETWVTSRFVKRPAQTYPHLNTLYIFHADDGFGVLGMSVFDSFNVSAGEIAAALHNGDPALACWFEQSNERHGVWAPTVERSFRGMRTLALGAGWDDDQIALARRAVAAYLRDPVHKSVSYGLYSSYEDVFDADAASQRILWRGVALDAAAIVTLVGLLWSFSGWRAWFVSRSWSRKSRRLARGCCVSCGYDLRGIDNPLCPECGKTTGAR